MIILQKVSKTRQVKIVHFASWKCARVCVCHAGARLREYENVVQAVLNLFILKYIHYVSSHFNRDCQTDPSMMRIDHRLVGVDPLWSGEIDTI